MLGSLKKNKFCIYPVKLEEAIIIRELTTNEQEINRVMEIWKESTIQAHSFMAKEYWLQNYTVVKEKYIPMSITYLYLEDNEIKGFISIVDGQFIGALFVAVNCQGKGIGRKLLDHVKGIYDRLTLAVYKDNEQAVSFYQKNGFVLKQEQLNKETNHLEYRMSFEK